MAPNDLRSLVALMRELGISHYEISKGTDLKVVLGVQPRLEHPQEDARGSEQAPEGGSEELPEAYRRLPVAYRDPRLYGGKLPKLTDG